MRNGQRLHIIGYKHLATVYRLQMADGVQVDIAAEDIIAFEPEDSKFPDKRDAAPGQGEQNQAEGTTPQELFGRLSPSVFVVEALNKRGSVVATGSAVAVAPDEVVTNKHVIKEGVAWRVRHGSKTWPAILTHLDSDHDLCQLKADGLNAPPVPVRASSTLAVGERVYAIGAPEGLELSLSEGLISGLREFEKVRLIQTPAGISHGPSGGGLFDAQGRLVGITTFFLKEGQNLNFALPGEWVQALATRQFSARQRTETDSPAFQALQWFQLGYAAYDVGEYEKAVRAYRESIRLNPDDAVAWYNLGLTYWNLGQYDQAIGVYREAIRLKPDYADAWNNFGATYADLGQHDQAVRALQEAIRLKPDYTKAWYNLGATYTDLGQHDQAVRALPAC